MALKAKRPGLTAGAFFVWGYLTRSAFTIVTAGSSI